MTGVLLDKADSMGPPLITLACGVQLLQRYMRYRRRHRDGVAVSFRVGVDLECPGNNGAWIQWKKCWPQHHKTVRFSVRFSSPPLYYFGPCSSSRANGVQR